MFWGEIYGSPLSNNSKGSNPYLVHDFVYSNLWYLGDTLSPSNMVAPFKSFLQISIVYYLSLYSD